MSVPFMTWLGEEVLAVLVAWVAQEFGERVLRDLCFGFYFLLAVAVAAFALQASAGFLGEWLPSWEHSEVGTSLYHSHKRRVYVPCGGRSLRRPADLIAWKFFWEASGLLE
jgi:hypothetical protein